jgi:DNA-binding transcriptional ArsR family regulator
MRNSETSLLERLKAVASPIRLSILADLKAPTKNYPPQVDGDPLVDGICADFIRERLGIAAATASRHLTLLVDAGLLVPTRKKGWTFYRRDEEALRRLADDLSVTL